MTRDRSRGNHHRVRARPIDFWEDKMFEVVGIRVLVSTRVANFLNLTDDGIIFFSLLA